jgi:hypothetical protein
MVPMSNGSGDLRTAADTRALIIEAREDTPPILARDHAKFCALHRIGTAFTLAGCDDFAERIAVRLFYRDAVLPENQVHKNLSYWSGAVPMRTEVRSFLSQFRHAFSSALSLTAWSLGDERPQTTKSNHA